MSDGITIQIEGGKELEKLLKSLEPKLQRKAVRSAVTKGVNVIRQKQRDLCRQRVGGKFGRFMARHIKSKSPRRQRAHQYLRGTGFESDVPEFVHITKSGLRYYIPTAIEYGHAFPGRGRGQKGGAPKDVAARPFMRPAYALSHSQAMQTTLSHLTQAINNENKRVAG